METPSAGYDRGSPAPPIPKVFPRVAEALKRELNSLGPDDHPDPREPNPRIVAILRAAEIYRRYRPTDY